MDKPYGQDKAQSSTPDFEELSRNMALFIEGASRATAAYLKPLEERQAPPDLAGETAGAIKTLGRVAEAWMGDPQKTFEAQARLGTQFMSLWASTLKRAQGEPAEPVAAPEPKDSRFKDPEWSENPIFDFLKQAYLISSRWAEDLVENAEGLDERTRHKAQFYLKQLSSALSPSNFLLTNPELIRETIKENGANLARGMSMLAEDIQAGGGELKIRQTDPGNFKIGVNIATTPGKVIFRNDLIELIQYAPTTEKVLKRPLLIVPPWINKYYILDLSPEKSFVKWAVDQGQTVFMISWVNPDKELAHKSFEDYMREGILEALDAVQQATGARAINALGYCVGGTLLAATLAYMAATGDNRVKSATFLTTQVDFSQAGDLKVFMDEQQVAAIERDMAQHGYLEGHKMAAAFNLLRSNDLIWPYVVDVYMKGKTPLPFDLLFWNSDSTRMPAANHSFYLRRCYINNDLAQKRIELGGITLDLSQVTIPVYHLAAREDHIAPARSVYLGAKLLGGPVRVVVSGSGHIAGVVNPPVRNRYQYWTGEPPTGELETWLEAAQEHPGSWWPDWRAWIEARDRKQVPAREIGGGKLAAIEDAPGSYVRVKS